MDKIKDKKEYVSKIMAGVKDLGFDHFEIRLQEKKELAVRIALGSICRENCLRETSGIAVLMYWNSRKSTVAAPLIPAEELLARIKQARSDLVNQSEDKECILPENPPRSFKWVVARENFDDLYVPNLIYSIIENELRKFRAPETRISGYFEASGAKTHVFTLKGFDLETEDNGCSVEFTVENLKTGGAGNGSQSSTYGTKQEITRIIAESLEEASFTCHQEKDSTPIDPGDYPVIFNPAAMRSLLNYLFVFLIKRKIDEKTTFLSNKIAELRFPSDLIVRYPLTFLDDQGINYTDSPFNERNVLCSPLTLIEEGKIRDLFVSPFWAKKCGLDETFLGYPMNLELKIKRDSPLTLGIKTLKDLIAKTEKGIFVNNLWYIRMVSEMEGTITGMTRNGIFEIKDGKINRPIKHMRWHENPFKFLANITGATEKRTLLGVSRLAGGHGLNLMPAIRSEGFHFSSVTLF